MEDKSKRDSARQRKRKEREYKRSIGLIYRGFWIKESDLKKIEEFLSKL